MNDLEIYMYSVYVCFDLNIDVFSEKSSVLLKKYNFFANVLVFVIFKVNIKRIRSM